MHAALFGLIVADLIAEPMDLRHPPQPGGLARLNSLQLTTGGNVCNTGIAMAKLGMDVAAAGMVGDDVLGKALVERMSAAGLDTAAIETSGAAQTSATVVAVETGRGTGLLPHPGSDALDRRGGVSAMLPVVQAMRLVAGGLFRVVADADAGVALAAEGAPEVRAGS